MVNPPGLSCPKKYEQGNPDGSSRLKEQQQHRSPWVEPRKTKQSKAEKDSITSKGESPPVANAGEPNGAFCSNQGHLHKGSAPSIW